MKAVTSQVRNNYAIAKTELKVLVFNTEAYNNLINKKITSAYEKKIDFLLRFGPKLRDVGRSVIENYHKLWQ